MAIDPYSLCPGGTGKKIKFCCPDLLGDLNTLVRMIEGQQHAAALRHLESMDSGDKPRACLAALKIQLLRAASRDEEVKAVVRQFLEHFPENPIALAESAIEAAGDEDAPAAMRLLQKAIAAVDKHLYSQVYDAIGVVAGLMDELGFFRAAQALLHSQIIINKDDSQPREALSEMIRADEIPLLVRDESFFATCPEGSPIAAPLEEAMQPLAQGNWPEMARRLEKLTEQAPDEPAAWRNLAIVRGWLADQAGAAVALERYAALDVPLEEAVEAAATALLLTDDPLGDMIDGLQLIHTVEEADELAGLFSTWKHAAVIPVDPAMMANEEVPPKMMFWLLDRPMADPAAELTLNTVSRVLGHVALFGRQTDREARLVVMGATSDDEEIIGKLLAEIAGGRIVGPPQREVVARLSATRTLLHRPWRFPSGVPRETVQALAAKHLERAVFETWPQRRLGALGGRSVEQAASEPDKRIRLLAVILVLDQWLHQMDEPLDLNRLRDRLGLPTLGPIDLENTPLERLPLVRYSRVVVEQLDDKSLLGGFHRAAAYRVDQAIVAFGRELIDRTEVDAEEKLFVLATLAQTESDSQRALDYVERGRVLAESSGQSSAPWDLFELERRMVDRDIEGVRRVFDHLQRDHAREPGVAAALGDFLYRAGVIDEQGRPTRTETVPDAVPDAAEEEESASRLWTPDSEKPAGAKSKLWMPE
ncbi:MAG: hypothetical protein JW719_07760 [Pirellulales bacterium]|nr:hypothetical protein [Pirellulales bacterium]